MSGISPSQYAVLKIVKAKKEEIRKKIKQEGSLMKRLDLANVYLVALPSVDEN